MKTERDIEIRICVIESEIAKEKKSQSPSDTKINDLKKEIETLLWVIN
jgi:hypothetical protein